MAEQSTEAAPTLFHVEVQEVFYWTYAIDAARKDLARTLVMEKKRGEVVGRKLVSRLMTNVHPVTDNCTEIGCYQRPSEEEAYPECPNCAVALAPGAAHAGDCVGGGQCCE